MAADLQVSSREGSGRDAPGGPLYEARRAVREFQTERRGVSRGGRTSAFSGSSRRRTSDSIDLPRGCGGFATSARRAPGLAIALGAALALSACEPYIQGNGVYREEDRTAAIGTFEGIRLESGIGATVTAGAGARSVRVSGDANVVRYVRTEVRTEMVRGIATNVLRVWVDVPSGGYSSTYPLRATVDAPEIRFAAAEGRGAALALANAAAPDLVLEASSAAEILVQGPGGPAVHATLSDASVDAGGYPTQTADVLLTGASRIELAANGSVTGDAWGTSEVDNLLGAGTCDVVLHDAAKASCR